MKFTATVEVSRKKAVDMLVVAIFAGAEITSKAGLRSVFETHISSFGELVWPELRGFTPDAAKIAALRKRASKLLTEFWPDFA